MDNQTHPNASEVAEIARGLTDAQRRYLAKLPRVAHLCDARVTPSMFAKGLVSTGKFERAGRMYDPTELGILVRSHLTGEGVEK